MCKENSLPVVVFNLNIAGNIEKLAAGETVGTLVG
jgi:uridylate kinase